MEVNDSHNEVRIEHVIALNQHAKRLFPALYSIHKRLATEEYQFLYNKEKKDKKNAVVMTEEQAEEIGCLLRLPIAILFHFMNFQGKAYSLLLDCVNHSKQLDFTGNYIFSKPVAELFTNYVKLHIFLTQFDDLQLVISFYKQSLEITKKSESQGLKYLSEFLQERETLKPVEAELQFMSEHLASFFRSVGPSILPLLNEASLYDWSKITISDAPNPSLENESFLKSSYLTMIFLQDICEYYITFGFVFSHLFPEEPILCEVFNRITQHVIVYNLYQDFNIDIKTVFSSFKKYKDKKLELNLAVFENIEERYKSTVFRSAELRKRKLVILIRQFIAAVETDRSLLFTKYPVALALLGYSNFEIRTSFRLKESRPNIEFYEPEIMELINFHSYLATIVIRNSYDLRRFFIFNLREYDANYLDTLTHSYSLKRKICDNIEQLIVALRSIDITQFDQDTNYDLYPCLSFLRTINSELNSHSTSHGISHLEPLHQLLSGVFFRINIYQNTYDFILEISKIHTYWQHITNLEALVKDSNSSSSRFDISIFRLAHFYGCDLDGSGELPDFKQSIDDHYDRMIKLLSSHLVKNFKILQNEGYGVLKEQMSVKNILNCSDDKFPGSESTMSKRSRFRPAYHALIKLTQIFTISYEIGIINVVGSEHNLHDELLKSVQFSVLHSLEDNVKPPTEMRKELSTIKWTFQLLANAACICYKDAFDANMEALIISSDSKTIGPVLQTYIDKYTYIANEDLKTAYYSNILETFVSSSDKSKLVYFISKPALLKLQQIIGTKGCLSIFQSLTTTFAKLFNDFLSSASKLSSKEESNIKNGFISSPDSDKYIKLVCHLGAILKLREMFRQYTGINDMMPHEDGSLLKEIKRNESLKYLQDNRISQFIGALFSCQYWENFEYDVAHDAIKDNSHLLGKVLDVICGTLIALKKLVAPDLFYIDYFKKMFIAIGKGRDIFANNKKVNFPYLVLLLAGDHIIKSSCYADYSSIENLVSYQYIRSLYTTRITRYMKEVEAPVKSKKKEKEKKDQKERDKKEKKEKEKKERKERRDRKKKKSSK